MALLASGVLLLHLWLQDEKAALKERQISIHVLSQILSPRNIDLATFKITEG